MDETNVVVLEPTSLSLDAAEAYGKIEYVSVCRLNIFNIDSIIHKTISKLRAIEFIPSRDYICLTGQGQKLPIFLAAVASEYKEFKILMFDARESKYKERVFRNESS